MNVNLGVLRKKLIKEKWMKVAEAVFFAFMTSTVFYLCAIWRSGICKTEFDDNIQYVKFDCT